MKLSAYGIWFFDITLALFVSMLMDIKFALVLMLGIIAFILNNINNTLRDYAKSRRGGK